MRNALNGHGTTNAVIIAHRNCGTLDYYRRELRDMAGVDSWMLSWKSMSTGPEDFAVVSPSSMVAAGQSGILYHFTIARDQIRLLRGPGIPHVFVDIEPDVPHVYRFDLWNAGPTGTYQFSIDGAIIDAGDAEGYYPTDDSFVIWGAQAPIVDSMTRWDWIELGVPEERNPIPAASQWSVAILTLLLLTAGTHVFRRHRVSPSRFGGD